MSTLTLGTIKQFDSSAAGEKSVARLSNTKFVIAFKDEDDNDNGKVIIGTVSGTTVSITDDSAVIFEAGNVSKIEVKAFSETSFVIAYKDDSDGNKVKLVAGTVSGTTITLGSIVELDANTAGAVGVETLSSGVGLAVYMITGSTAIYQRAFTLSGTTITMQGSADTLFTHAVFTNCNCVKLAPISTTKALIFFHFNNAGTAERVDAIVGTVDLDTYACTHGTSAIVKNEAGSEAFFFVAPLNTMYFIVGCDDDVIPVKVDGATITVGTPVEIEAAASSPAVVGTDSTHWITAYIDTGDSNKGKVLKGTADNNVFTADGVATDFEADPTDDIAACKLLDQYFIICHKETPA